MLRPPTGVVLQEVAIIDHGCDDLFHVVGHVGAVRQDLVEFGAEAIGIVACFDPRRLVEIVGRQETQQVFDFVKDLLLGVGNERRNPRLAAVTARSAEFFKRHLLTGNCLDNIGTGDEHVRFLAHHEDEVGHGGAVDRAACTGAEDHRDLRDHS